MSDNNPYQTPGSNLDHPVTSEQDLNPNWTIEQVLSEAWSLVSGFKATFLGAALIYAFIAGGITFALKTVGGDGIAMQIITQLILGLVISPLAVGLIMIAIKRSAGLPVNAFMIFDYYSKILPLFLLNLAMTVLIILGFLLFILPGIYLSLAYFMAAPLLVEKNLSVWEALETSRKTLTPRWFSFFGLILILMVLVILSAIPLGIGLIWTMPLLGLSGAIVYRNFFGVSSNQQTVDV